MCLVWVYVYGIIIIIIWWLQHHAASHRVPDGAGDQDNVIISTYGNDKRKKISSSPSLVNNNNNNTTATEAVSYKWHDDVAKLHNWCDFEAAGRMSGTRFGILVGNLSRLQRELAR